MENIKDTVQDIMQVLKTKNKGSAMDSPEALLKKALAKKELSHIKFSYLKKGILCINVDSSTWLYHLSLQKEDLLAKLNKKFRTIKDIRFRLGEVK